MCGVCGIIGFADGFAADEATVTRMRETLTHRGPDDAGAIVRSSERLALGHRRLSIVDLSPAGHQPMANEDGTVWIVYNGEVYNHGGSARSSRPRVTGSSRAPTPRRSSTFTRKRGQIAYGGSKECSRWQSGTGGAASFSWLAIGSA
jgi:Glutamine amidotransferase domain